MIIFDDKGIEDKIILGKILNTIFHSFLVVLLIVSCVPSSRNPSSRRDDENTTPSLWRPAENPETPPAGSPPDLSDDGRQDDDRQDDDRQDDDRQDDDRQDDDRQRSERGLVYSGSIKVSIEKKREEIFNCTTYNIEGHSTCVIREKIIRQDFSSNREIQPWG